MDVDQTHGAWIEMCNVYNVYSIHIHSHSRTVSNCVGVGALCCLPPVIRNGIPETQNISIDSKSLRQYKWEEN